MRTSDDRLFDRLREKVETLTGERADGARRALMASDLTKAISSSTESFNKIVENIKSTLDTGYVKTAALSAAGEFAANVASKVLQTTSVWSDASEKTVAMGGVTYVPDFSQGWNFILGTTQSTNFVLANPINQKVGQAGTIRIVQDAYGGRTWSLGNQWKTTGGIAPALSTMPFATDLLSYKVISLGFVQYSLAKDVR